MKAFISYSHKDEAMLQRLHTHLAQLKRDGQLQAWTDELIPTGGIFGDHISLNLSSSGLFIALLSPDYIASNYCYEREFQTAMQMHQEGKLIIVPIILEPCDWKSTPFGSIKALPKDGNPISLWSNQNTAFVNVIQELRSLMEKGSGANNFVSAATSGTRIIPSREYKVKKDFDSIHKMEFVEDSYKSIKSALESFLNEIIHVDPNIRYRIISSDSKSFEAILVNGNKKEAESTLVLVNSAKLTVKGEISSYHAVLGRYDIGYTFGSERSNVAKGYMMGVDEYHLFWKESSFFGRSQENKEFSAKDIAEAIWADWLENIGIM